MHLCVSWRVTSWLWLHLAADCGREADAQLAVPIRGPKLRIAGLGAKNNVNLEPQACMHAVMVSANTNFKVVWPPRRADPENDARDALIEFW